MTRKKPLKAIDLYSGVGGWSLGLKLAGIEVVASYEWWHSAARSNEKNNCHPALEGDIRALPLKAFRHDVEIVVGSPPCTEFSFSNRGGKGDIENGLRDIRKFLEVVEYVKPKYWLMENVPRVAQILREELKPGGSLEKFARLKPNIHVVDMEEFGVPQSRSRCIAGNIDFELLLSYRSKCPTRTLGSVIKALSNRTRVTDPIYKVAMKAKDLIDHELETPLSPEEERMNREAKTFHPVYNNMAFPDRIDRPVRTITATCTRVSRESVVVMGTSGGYRRLSVRERASLQGFPITFQFYGDSYQQKLKMVGNAIPPLFTFYAAQAMKGTPAWRLNSPSAAIKRFKPPVERPKDTTPDSAGREYSADRRFRAALPNLRFKSGVRFELANDVTTPETSWNVRFYFGNSKNIHEVWPNQDIVRVALQRARKKWGALVDRVSNDVAQELGEVDQRELQRVWTRTSTTPHGHPFEIVDFLGTCAKVLLDAFQDEPLLCRQAVQEVLDAWATALASGTEIQGLRKVLENSPAVMSGLLVALFANDAFSTPRATRSTERKLSIAA